MRKRCQAAVEFLMTYGWAILIVLIVLGILSYTGVFKDKFLPQKCVIQPGIHCDDFRIKEDAVTLVLKNVQGRSMTVESIEVEHCTGTISESSILENDAEAEFIIDGCSNIANEKFDGEAIITYSLDGGLSRKKIGHIVGRVEEGFEVLFFSDNFDEDSPRQFGFSSPNPLPPDWYAGWTVYGGAWVIENGYLKNWFGGEGNDRILLNSPPSQAGRTIRAKVLENYQYTYPIFLLGWQDESNYYTMGFASTGSSGSIKISKTVAGESTELAVTYVDLDLYTWYWMEFRWVSPTKLEGEVWDLDWNSLATVEATISEGWTTGSYGLRGWRGMSACWFDDIQIRRIT